MSEENDNKILAREIEEIQKRLTRHQILLEMLILLIILLIAVISAGTTNLFTFAVGIIILFIMIARVASQVEKQGI
jgi:hypothetical protein